MPTGANSANLVVTVLAIVAVLAITLLRNRKPRKLRVEFLWIRPAILLAYAAIFLVLFPPRSMLDAAGWVAAFLVGAGIGWWRGGFTRIEVDPVTHMTTSQTSPLGMLLVLGLLVVRMGLRSAVLTSGGKAPVTGDQITGWLFGFLFGLVALQQLEIWLRARKLIAVAKAG